MKRLILIPSILPATLAVGVMASPVDAQVRPRSGKDDVCRGVLTKVRGKKPDADQIAACRKHLKARQRTLRAQARSHATAVAQTLTFKVTADNSADEVASAADYLRGEVRGSCRIRFSDPFASAYPFRWKSTADAWQTGQADQVVGHGVQGLSLSDYTPLPHGYSGVASFHPVGAAPSSPMPESYFLALTKKGQSSPTLQIATKVVRKPGESGLGDTVRTQRSQQGLARADQARAAWTLAARRCTELAEVDAQLRRLQGL